MKDGRLRKFSFFWVALLLIGAWMVSGDVQAADPAYDCAAQEAIPEDQCLALVMIYENTDGANWKLSTNWLESDDPCNWHGVSCVDGSLVALDLFNNNLKGELPLEIGAFPQLETLTLNDNPLTGAVPLTVTLLDLRLFHFHNTQLCEPADPSFQDWLLGVVYRLSTGVYCTPLSTATLPPSGPTQTQVQPTSDLPWPQQTLTALAVIAATEQAPTEELTPTPTKYYTLASPTPEPTETPVPVGDGSTSDESQAALEGTQPSFLGGIPKTWLLLLLIPVALIAIGLLLEIRERRKEAEPYGEDDEVSEALFKLDYFDPNNDEN
jgi:hypothetical protein